MTLCKDAAWLHSGTLKVNRNDRVDRLPVAAMVLAHADPAIARLVDHAVGKAPAARRRGWCRRERLRRAVPLAIKPPVGEIPEDERAARHPPPPSALPGPPPRDVERCGRWARRPSAPHPP